MCVYIADLIKFPLSDNTSTTPDLPQPNEVTELMDTLWTRMNSYTYNIDEYTQWYIMDNVGISLQHSYKPNCKCVPFIFFPSTLLPPIAICILWPIQNIEIGDVLTRDYLPYIPYKSPTRILRLLGYIQPTDNSDDNNDDNSNNSDDDDNNNNSNSNIRYINFIHHVINTYPTPTITPPPQYNTHFTSTTVTAPHPTATHTDVLQLEVPESWTKPLNILQSYITPKSPTVTNLKIHKSIHVYSDRIDHFYGTNFTIPYENNDCIYEVNVVDDPREAEVLYLIGYTVDTPAHTHTLHTQIKEVEKEVEVYVGDEYNKSGKVRLLEYMNSFVFIHI